MKLTHSLCLLICLSPLFSCNEVWVDNVFINLQIFKNLCEIFAEPQSDNVPSPSTNTEKDKPVAPIVSDSITLSSSDNASIPISNEEPIKSDYTKCDGVLKQDWLTNYPVAPNLIKINGINFLFITYREVQPSNLAYPDVLLPNDVLFTRFIYKNAPRLFDNIQLDGRISKIEFHNSVINANLKLVNEKKYQKAAADFISLLTFIPIEGPAYSDLIDYLNQNLMFSYHAAIMSLCNAEKGNVAEHIDCGSLKKSYCARLDKIVHSENSAFVNLLLANHAKYSGKPHFEQFFSRAAKIDHGDIYLTEELKKAGVDKDRAEDEQSLYKNLVKQLNELATMKKNMLASKENKKLRKLKKRY
jgi:hypothetical protein